MTGSERCGDVFGVVLEAELREALELLLTEVGAAEKDVCDLWGISAAVCTGAGTVIGEGVVLALSVWGACGPPVVGVCRPPIADCRPSRAALCPPSAGNAGDPDLSTADSGGLWG